MSLETAYGRFIPEPLTRRLCGDALAVNEIPGLRIEAKLIAEFPQLLTPEALRFVVDLYQSTSSSLETCLDQRVRDRHFLDERTKLCVDANESLPYTSPDYRTVVGDRDPTGRMVVGPLPPSPVPAKPVSVPTFLQGDHVTLFGPPDSTKMAINAMNTLHRKLPNEADIVEELVRESGQVPRWGADNEDSKTPITANLLSATENLMACFRHDIAFDDPNTGRRYRLQEDGLSIPIKRVPGLALPSVSFFFDGRPMPLHLVDFALHLFHNRDIPEALVFYVPKLEGEKEALYFAQVVRTAENLLKKHNPGYGAGTVRLFVVFENPRAIFRIPEMAEALHPYFVGGSLGWHDFLASTARLMRHDHRYRIPVKADPNIVIDHIRESHQILVDAMAPIGGVAIGGMYGVLYEDGNPASFEVSMVGYLRDVITQLKRGLDGFWVAHPSFVRIGIALVEAYRRYRSGQRESLERLVVHLLPDTDVRQDMWTFIEGDDVVGLRRDEPGYARGVLAADLEGSEVIANHDPAEVRYNIFQALQYLADWLAGRGCVALPATMRNRKGKDVFVRVMDDLATTERSRWELWAEVFHGRVAVEVFEQLLHEEITFLQAGIDTETKKVQVPWTGEYRKWYPIAVEILRELVLTAEPVEFVTELLLAYTVPEIRAAADPRAALRTIVG
jgi:malate synthase